MKKVLFSVSVIALAFFACDKKEIEQNVSFDLNMNPVVNLPAYTATDSTVTITMDSIVTNSQKLADDNKISLDDIKRVVIKSVKLTIIEPVDGQTFSFADSLTVHLGASGLGELLLASIYPIADDPGKELSVTVNEASVIDYIKKDMVNVKITVGVDEALPQDTKVRVDLVYTVDGVVKVGANK